MAEPALAYLPDPVPCPALAAILAEDEHTLPETDGLPLADGRVQQGPLTYSRDALRYHLRDHVAVEGDMFIYYVGRDSDGEPTLDQLFFKRPASHYADYRGPLGGGGPYMCGSSLRIELPPRGRRLRHPRPQRRQGDTEGSRQGATRPVNARPCRRNGS